MYRSLIQLKNHPHKVHEQVKTEDEINKDPFKAWICSGHQQNGHTCKNTQSPENKINDSSIIKYICEKKCSNFIICGSCVNDMQDVAILPDQVEHPLHVKHPLQRCYHQDDQWICNAKDYLGCVSSSSNQSIDLKTIERYNCNKCKFDLCQKCVFFYLENPQMTYLHQVNSNIHEHIMTRQFEDNGWCCDGQKKNKGGCLSGITGFGQTANFNRWRCNECDFDLCEKCLQATIIDACPFQTPPTRQTYKALLESIQNNNNNTKVN